MMKSNTTAESSSVNNESVEIAKPKYAGVSLNKRARKYVAQYKHDNKTTYLGLFTNPVEAAIKYDDAIYDLRLKEGEYIETRFRYNFGSPQAPETTRKRAEALSAGIASDKKSKIAKKEKSLLCLKAQQPNFANSRVLPGISFYSSRQIWKVSIQMDKKKYYIGKSHDYKEAVKMKLDALKNFSEQHPQDNNLTKRVRLFEEKVAGEPLLKDLVGADFKPSPTQNVKLIFSSSSHKPKNLSSDALTSVNETNLSNETGDSPFNWLFEHTLTPDPLLMLEENGDDLSNIEDDATTKSPLSNNVDVIRRKIFACGWKNIFSEGIIPPEILNSDSSSIVFFIDTKLYLSAHLHLATASGESIVFHLKCPPEQEYELKEALINLIGADTTNFADSVCGDIQTLNLITTVKRSIFSSMYDAQTQYRTQITISKHDLKITAFNKSQQSGVSSSVPNYGFSSSLNIDSSSTAQHLSPCLGF